MLTIHLDPRLPDLTDAPIDDQRIAEKIAAGRIPSDAWVSHPLHTKGTVVRAMRVPKLLKLFVQSQTTPR